MSSAAPTGHGPVGAPPAVGAVGGADGPGHPIRIRLVAAVPVIEIPAELEFAALRDWLRARLPEQIEAVGGRSARLDLGSRPIHLFDLRRLVNLLREEFSVDITGLYVEADEVWAYAERELKLKLFQREAAPTLDVGADGEIVGSPDADASGSDDAAADDPTVGEDPPEIAVAPVVPPPRLDGPADADPLDELLGRGEAPGARVLRVNRTLRSGASVRFDGDVIVFGDVNPGAQIVATGNVVVLGALKGLAHAGATGDEAAILFGLDLRPTQVRIARKIAIAPNEGATAGLEPTVARIADGRIVLEPYRTRSTR